MQVDDSTTLGSAEIQTFAWLKMAAAVQGFCNFHAQHHGAQEKGLFPGYTLF